MPDKAESWGEMNKNKDHEPATLGPTPAWGVVQGSERCTGFFAQAVAELPHWVAYP